MLAEYTRILFISFLFGLVFMGGGSNWFFIIFFIVVAFLFVWVRGTLPRFRYDKLMFLAWKCFLPFSLSYLVLTGGLLVFII
jgi:NADH-ubiquinone oxidoreductase chain 1